MAMMGSSAWSGQEHGMHTGADDDFQQFLDMNGMGTLPESLNFDFHDFQNPAVAHMPMQAPPPPRDHMDTPMSGTETPVIITRADSGLQHQMATSITAAQSYQTIPTTGMIAPPTPGDTIVTSIDAQIQYLQQQKLHHQQAMEEQHAFFAHQQQNRIVPPTPQSLELQAGNSNFYPQRSMAEQTPQHQALDYRFQRIKEQQDMSFTPLVSPAVTPLETSHFPVDGQFTVPGAYFSPLTSPALHAQTDPLAGYDPRHGPVSTSSPGEMDLEMPGPGLQSNTGDLAKKAKKTAPKTRAKAGVRQSPISKPLRRRTTTTPNMNAQVLSELAENAGSVNDSLSQKTLPGPSTSTSSNYGATDSENGSVSPETLNEIVSAEMPPPPIPASRSARPSPYMAPQSDKVSTPNFKPRHRVPSPATPASLLMKLSSPGNRAVAAKSGDQEMEEVIENLELPESATNFARPNLTPLNTDLIVPSPIISGPSSSKTPAMLPLPSPSFPKPPPSASISQSPLLAPGSGSAGLRKTPQLLPRGSKKRSSISSVHVSPALRPKISPSIKPLLPGGASAEDTASHLLATKSNYQRILEGNTVPGVNYPSELSTNLTSKRTSHKIAEQGRRNRINSALLEIATLLPKQPPKEPKGSDDEGGDKKDKAGSIPSSKASTVEMAIEYIKQLRQEVEEANRRAEEAERQLEIKTASEAGTTAG